GKWVTIRTCLSICPEHCAQRGCQDPSCLDLHVCRFYFLSECNFKGNACRFGHDLQSPHNVRALRYHLLNGLTDDQIGALLRLCRSEATLPRVCKFYCAGGKGCSKQVNCQDLHLCKFFILGSCSFENKCKRSHNIGDQQVVNILRTYGLNGRAEDELNGMYSGGATAMQPDKNYSQGHPSEVLPHAGSSPKKIPVKQSPNSKKGLDKEGDKMKMSSIICVHALVDQCKFGEKCLKVHSSKPYQWQYEGQDGEWISVPDQANDELQKKYVLPSNADCRDCPFASSKVRLVTTPSSSRSVSKFATEWIWYWKDEWGNWNEYGIARGGLDKADISSKDIEDAYAEDTPFRSFSTQRFKYKIDLQKMVQRNLIEDTERPVSRRPRLPGVGDQMVSSHSESSHIPSHWDKIEVGSGTYTFVEVDRGSPEWSTLSNKFRKTMPNERVREIVRIQNEELWEAFSWKKKWMQKDLTDVNEKLLFHGTRKEYVDAIAQQGFDWRISGLSVGTKFGKGSYFARDASYSKNYTDSRQLFLVRVLVGDTVQGHPNYVKPPMKSSPGGKAYNSCVNDPSNPAIYVIFEHAQTYPEYLITY
ncbi:hypothetical protein CAPTEDRAFT_33318, partial [Capitella teleta]